MLISYCVFAVIYLLLECYVTCLLILVSSLIFQIQVIGSVISILILVLHRVACLVIFILNCLQSETLTECSTFEYLLNPQNIHDWLKIIEATLYIFIVRTVPKLHFYNCQSFFQICYMLSYLIHYLVYWLYCRFSHYCDKSYIPDTFASFVVLTVSFSIQL